MTTMGVETREAEDGVEGAGVDLAGKNGVDEDRIGG